MGTPRKVEPRACRQCGSKDRVSPRSKLCIECAMGRVQASIEDMQDRSGPIYGRWRRGLLKALREMNESG